MSNQVHIVPHMHWDREWYFTAEESKILLINNMEEIFERLENDPEYPVYVLDGQTAILEDYLQLMPHKHSQLRKLVQEGRLIIGPWYTQTDEMVVGAESIVRNLLYGHKDCAAFGPVMDIGYLPDSFGQSGQLPMILNGFNIKRAMFWRGTSERMGSNKTEFYWTSDDGSKVLTQLLPLGYAIGKYLPTDFEGLKERCSKYMPVLERGATGDHILIPNGHDQMPIQKNIREVMAQLKNIYPDKNFFLSSYDALFKELEKKTDYDTLHGELLDGKYMRVHRSIFSSRSDIKAINTRIENKITNILEPLASIAFTLGFDYFAGSIESIYKDIMKNHAHDSIGCCCSDEVHDEIMYRFILAEDKLDKLITFYKRKITDAMPCDIALDKVNVFNLLPYNRNEVITTKITTRMKAFELVDEEQKLVEFDIVSSQIIDAGLIDRQIVHYGNYDPFVEYTIQLKQVIPAMGYKTFFVVEKAVEMNSATKTATTMENRFYHIEFNQNGSIQLFDKINNKMYEEVLLIEDGSDDGDGYDFSPLLDDLVITSKDAKAKVEVKRHAYSSHATIAFTMQVPADLEQRKLKNCDKILPIKLDIKLNDDSQFIDIGVTINNTVKDHRVRLLVPTMVAAKCSVSDNQFGMITRDVYDGAMDVWEEEKWSERPDAIYPMLSYVANKDDAIAVISNSVREFELIGDDYSVIAITLFRGVGFLGKEEMVRRPGRPSGIKMPTPDSQLQKEMTYSLGLVVEADQAKLSRKAKQFLTPLVSYNKMPYNAMKLNEVKFNTPYSYTLFNEANDDITLSVLKKAENSDDLIYRVFNTNETPKTVTLDGITIKSSANLNEEMMELDIKVNKNQVKTYILK